eukprot:4581296-Amphidinium_carterae.2
MSSAEARSTSCTERSPRNRQVASHSILSDLCILARFVSSVSDTLLTSRSPIVSCVLNLLVTSWTSVLRISDHESSSQNSVLFLHECKCFLLIGACNLVELVGFIAQLPSGCPKSETASLLT